MHNLHGNMKIQMATWKPEREGFGKSSGKRGVVLSRFHLYGNVKEKVCKWGDVVGGGGGIPFLHGSEKKRFQKKWSTRGVEVCVCVCGGGGGLGEGLIYIKIKAKV